MSGYANHYRTANYLQQLAPSQDGYWLGHPYGREAAYSPPILPPPLHRVVEWLQLPRLPSQRGSPPGGGSTPKGKEGAQTKRVSWSLDP